MCMGVSVCEAQRRLHYSMFAVPIPVFIHLHFFKAEFLSLAE